VCPTGSCVLVEEQTDGERKAMTGRKKTGLDECHSATENTPSPLFWTIDDGVAMDINVGFIWRIGASGEHTHLNPYASMAPPVHTSTFKFFCVSLRRYL
jgi:hypothetical protein